MGRISYSFAAGLVGLFCLLLGAGLAWYGARGLIRMWAAETLTLKNSSEAMARWVRPPSAITMKVYIFNVTNPEDVVKGSNPNLMEVGPYVYDQTREKVNVMQLDNFTLSYQVRNIIKFKKKSSGRLRQSDLVTVLNVPLIGAILSTHETVPEFVDVMNSLWQTFYPGQKNIFITTTVEDILFNGITIHCTEKRLQVYIACRGFETRAMRAVRKEGKNFKFAFFYSKNGTSRETYQIHQGIEDYKKTAQYAGVNYSPSIKVWKDRYCDMINGSDGTQFPVLVDKKQKLYIFEKDLCRSVYIEFEKEKEQKGVTLYKFSVGASLFASWEENPDNKCFCRPPLTLSGIVGNQDEDEDSDEEYESGTCFRSGILPLMSCTGSPLVASFPHFYLGDQSYVNYSGLNPNKDLHETYVLIEPVTGIVISGRKRIQFNLEMKRILGLNLTMRLSSGLFPILWLEEEMTLSDLYFKMIWYGLLGKSIVENGTFILIGVGSLLIVISFAAGLLKKRKIRQTTKSQEFISYPQQIPRFARRKCELMNERYSASLLMWLRAEMEDALQDLRFHRMNYRLYHVLYEFHRRIFHPGRFEGWPNRLFIICFDLIFDLICLEVLINISLKRF